MRPDPLERILAWGQETPDQSAIIQDGRTVSYGELRDLVLRASSALRSRGAERGASTGEAPVGIAMAPSIDMVAAVLSIRCAGYPYLPLPLEEIPASRREAILADSKPWLVVTDAPGRRLLAGAQNVDVRSITAWDEIAQANSSPEKQGATGPDADGLGYLIYTSGSTGTPKGVAMRWSALANLIDWQVGDARLGQAARTALLTPLTFDVSFQEIVGTLSTGGTLIVLDPALRRDPVSLARTLLEARIERIFLPFVGLQSLAEASTSLGVTPTALRDVVTAGEQLKVTPEIVRFFSSIRSSVEDACLHNHYGPAETHVVTAHVLSGDPSQWPDLPPIGAPITGVEVLALDEEGVERPPGSAGELFLGGACLARGYHELPEETRARFVADPRPGKSGRLYRTGDVGRRTADGVFEWIGRNDDQLKVRGHRVELGEVESVLARHENVAQVAVVPRPSGASQELVAYVRSDLQAELDGDAAAETLATWRGVWDRTYAESPTHADPTFDTAGWNSSLTGERLPDSHMQEWVDHTVDRILALAPRRVLEIGCGSGLLLHRVAPHCTHYAGLDYSRQVIEQLSETLTRQPEPHAAVTLTCAAAHELDACVDDPVDLVVMNSVLQHFPAPAYLLDVLDQAISVTATGGRIFVGDVTPHGFREAFFSWLEAPDGCAGEAERAAVRDRVQRRLALDRELTVDPPFFDLLGEALPRIAQVEVQARRGRASNELTDFRYDVILHLDRPGEQAASADTTAGKELLWAALDEDHRTIGSLLELVRNGVCIRGVPNARTRVQWQRLDDLSGEAHESDSACLDPTALFDAADRQGIGLELRPDTGSRTFSVGLVGACAPAIAGIEPNPDRPVLLRRLSVHASSPLRERTARALFPALREFAAEQLPDYMQPAAYVLLESFPRTASGKIDRRRLPSPSHRRPELAVSYAAPRTELEKTTERIWRDVLGLDRIGIDDSFFDLGGNSIGVMTLATRLGNELGREVPILALFEHPTVRTFAAQLEQPPTTPAPLGQGARGGRTRAAYQHRRNRRVSRGQR